MKIQKKSCPNPDADDMERYEDSKTAKKNSKPKESSLKAFCNQRNYRACTAYKQSLRASSGSSVT